jgi:hypothetical protein
MVEMRFIQNSFESLQGKRTLRRTRERRKDNIETDLGETECE